MHVMKLRIKLGREPTNKEIAKKIKKSRQVVMVQKYKMRRDYPQLQLLEEFEFMHVRSELMEEIGEEPDDEEIGARMGRYRTSVTAMRKRIFQRDPLALGQVKRKISSSAQLKFKKVYSCD